MRLLVLDTALDACQVGLFQDDRAILTLEQPMVRGGMERIALMTRDLMAAAGLSLETIDRIGVTVGPGSFTGLRVGLAFAQGLGAGVGRPVVGISSLDALAASVGSEPDVAPGPVLAVIDARRGQVYARAFDAGRPTMEPMALTLEAARTLADRLGPRPILVGSGAPLLAEGREGARVIPLAAPRLAAVAQLALAADPAQAPPRPLYLRAPDATPPTRRPGAPRREAP
ncbi:MAG: tRNA (adenosine(37)-N6)-threonylcarbamoyltransferase complex dimerization subunit type 1 TsaB [Brevundimonas sp.]|uniref:tRNA (adenosine(37)-N6)-threonylcarbamoyltransferase complex dimerization subunit type 1 TsaB n=1 Tax=Brevundimonas sp. TaxID=1871086 RepID=UPI0025C0912A|nr:tRNA (adenosine(37)-N6)-threonylcarbamoyltransferase complex dimerization subunit type 1 TsaB [Brevundimonas sp.]MBX3478166.1 tRNA (adenosine(37)-N6)-threonylcarbamoyltransferase complex dimerization subunit type 1 TsaB [Brevundimonas sp.]